jgi:FAD/FMN-containing dehydrogenase
MVQSGIDQLREQVRGAVITPDDEGYEQARRVYNAMIDRRPAAVVRCANAGDVVAAVNFAREHQLDLAVRGGEHSVPGFGTCDDGVVIDLSGMRGVRVDQASRSLPRHSRRHVGAGLRILNLVADPHRVLRVTRALAPFPWTH